MANLIYLLIMLCDFRRPFTKLRLQVCGKNRSIYMPADVNTAFDVAFYLEDIALNDHEYLQPIKLQRLLFLAQAYYAVAFKGRKLMPAVFVADELGPIEPNIYMAFSKGRPDVDVDLFMPPEVTSFLDNIWRKFGSFTVDKLTEIR